MKSIFLSYSVEEQHHANLIRAWLKSEPNLEVNFTSAPIHGFGMGASVSRAQISADIEAASLVICLVGNSRPNLWQEWEIQKAVESKRPMIAISTFDGEMDSSPYTQRSIPIVRWTLKELAEALKSDGHSVNYELSDEKIIQIPILRVDFEDISKRLTQHFIQTPSEMLKLSPRKFEELIAYILEEMGYEITLTGQTRDDGIDIFALKKEPIGSFLTLVECKKYSPHRRVGIDIVRSLYGVLNIQRASHAMIATTSSFTGGARNFEKQYQFQMSLRDHADIINWMKHNTNND